MCNKSMCIHTKVSGRYAIQALLTADRNDHVCVARRAYLEKQMARFAENCADFHDVYWETKEFLQELWLGDEGEVMSSLIDQYEVIPTPEEYMELFDESEEKLEGMYHSVAITAAHKASKARRYNWLVNALEIEKKVGQALAPIHEIWLRDRRVPLNTWKRLKKFKARLNDLRFKYGEKTINRRKRKLESFGCISWTQWAMLTNYINKLMGSNKRYAYNDDEDLALELHELRIGTDQQCFLGDKEDRKHDLVLSKLEKEEVSRQALNFATEIDLWWENARNVGYPVK